MDQAIEQIKQTLAIETVRIDEYGIPCVTGAEEYIFPEKWTLDQVRLFTTRERVSFSK